MKLALCMHACVHAVLMLRTKGPAEKLAFPAVSQSTNPFTLLPSVLLLLGRKIDNALSLKDRCDINNSYLPRIGIVTATILEEKLDAHPSCPRAKESNAQNRHTSSQAPAIFALRFSLGIGTPLKALQDHNTKLINLQCQSVENVPSRSSIAICKSHTSCVGAVCVCVCCMHGPHVCIHHLAGKPKTSFSK